MSSCLCWSRHCSAEWLYVSLTQHDLYSVFEIESNLNEAELMSAVIYQLSLFTAELQTKQDPNFTNKNTNYQLTGNSRVDSQGDDIGLFS